MNRNMLTVPSLVVAAVLFVAVNVLSQATLRQSRLDLTANQLFTLSQGTRNILTSLKEPITLKLFFSEKLAGMAPQLRTYGQRVRELLEEYAHRSNGKIRLQVIDPEPFSDSEDRAVEAGIQGIPVDQGSGQPAYFGLVGTNSTDHLETLPYFSQEREQFLEYDISKLVYALTDPKRPVVGIITDMDLTYGSGGMAAAMRGEGKPYGFLRQLRESFDVRILRPDLTKPDLTLIDNDISVLAVIRPRKLAEPVLYAIDQYVLHGGKAIVYVDPYVESTNTPPDPATIAPTDAAKSATLPRLLTAWGIEMDAKRFVADPTLAVRVAVGEGGRRRAVPYPGWLSLKPGNFASDDPITADLASLMFGSAGALTKRQDAGISFTPLVFSSERAQLLDVTELTGQTAPEALMALLTPGGLVQTLVARIGGSLKTAFPEHKPVDGQPKPLSESVQPANLIVVADTDMLEDRFWVQEQDFLGQRMLVPFAANVDFLINSIDNLSGSGDLIGLRGRAGAARPFMMVENLNRAAAERFLAREQALRKKLSDIERQVAELQARAKPGSGSAILSKEEQVAMERYRSEVLSTRKELRQVQHSLNQNIERLSALVKAVNIAIVPMLVAFFALALAGWRTRRRRLTVRE
ncbi:MAG: Gldg family protein [Rhodospirillaceae bacterium]